MEKKKPTYDLEAIKEGAANPDKLEILTSAIVGAASVGYGRDEIVATIQSMSRTHFYKSMTSVKDHRIWQDVYHVPSPVGLLYVKFSSGILADFILLSFKER